MEQILMHKSFLNWVNRNLTKHDTINDTEQCFCSYSPGNKKTFNSFRFHWKSIFAFFFFLVILSFVWLQWLIFLSGFSQSCIECKVFKPWK